MIRLTLAKALVGTATVTAATVGFAYLENQQASNPIQPQVAGTSPPPAAVTGQPMDFPTIVSKYGPAVVNITVITRESGEAQPVPGDIDPNDPFFEFFKHFAPDFQWPHASTPRVIRGAGSGFIISPDGLILTNAHVVDGANTVKVKLTDRREFRARVLGVDQGSDVALIRIPATGLPTVQLGDSSHVRAGEPVLAIGSPYGFENTATAGIVSAVARALPGESYVPFIQTDVAVNPGNSGGPLFNRDGQVIGINAQIYTQTGGYEGLSFSIPINLAKQVETQLLAHGRVVRGRLGIAIQDVDQGLARSFGLDRPQGALVNSVVPGSPAAQSGLKAGDIVTKVGDKAIDDSSDLAATIADTKPGTRITLTLLREHKPLTMNVTVAAAPNQGSITQNAGSADNRLGLTVRPLTGEEKRAAGVTAGILVEQAQGVAAQSGIERGDIILSLDATPVDSREQLRALLSKAGKQVALLIQRNGTRIFVPVEIG